MTETYLGKTVVEHRREFIENCQCGKQIGKMLDQQNKQKRPQARKPIFLGQESEKSENQVPFLEFLKIVKKVLTQSLCKMDHTLFQTSS